MSARRLACALAAAAIVAAFGGVVDASAQTISDLTSDLQNLQVRIAAGDKAAYASQAERISAVGAAIVAAKPEVWQSKHETDAAVIYLFSGGQPRDIVRLIESGAVPASEIPLMRGALAYVLGNEAEAEKRLSGIDARRLPLRLAGPMAFAQSVIETSRDSAKAIELLDLARLLAPGTLVEEAALRREVMLEADQHDVERVARLARQYASRFGALGLRRSLPADARRRAGAIRGDRQPGEFQQVPRLLRRAGARRASRLPARTGARGDSERPVRGRRHGRRGGARRRSARQRRRGARQALRSDGAHSHPRLRRRRSPSCKASLRPVSIATIRNCSPRRAAWRRSCASRPPSSAAPPPAADAAAMASANPNDAIAQTIVLAEAALGRTASLAAVAPKGNL